MEDRKRAWAYCSIDAPEDTHGALKGQYRQLVEYAEQMGFEVADSSSDIGNGPLWNRAGFQRFADKMKAGEALFTVKAEKRCSSYDEAFKLACEVGGKRFLTDMFSADQLPQEVEAVGMGQGPTMHM